MVDTNWPDFPDTNYVEETDILLALRGAGGVNILGSAFVKKRSDGHVAIQRGGAGAQELILSLDAGSTGFSVRDTQIRAGNNGSNQTYLDFYTSNAAAPAHAMRLAANGSVGIGTTNPLWKFHILGTASDLAGIISTGTSSGLLIGDNAAAIRLGTRSGAFIVDVGAERMRIGTNGNIAIGNTDTSRTLNVYNADCWLQLKNATNGWLLGPGSSTNFGIYDNTNSGYRLVVLAAGGHTAPGGDNVYSLGTASLRWTTVFATNGAINTSDAREKLWRGFSDELKSKVRRIATAIMDELGWFQFLDQVEKKGEDGARWHFGPTAQAAWNIVAAEGLCAPLIGEGAEQRPDPSWTGSPPPAFLCYDIWPDRYDPVFEEQQIGTEAAVIGLEPTGILDAQGQPIMREVTEERPIMGQVQIGEQLVQAAGNRFGLRVDQMGLLLDWEMDQRHKEKDAVIADLAARVAALEAA